MARRPLTRELRERAKAWLRQSAPTGMGYVTTRLLLDLRDQIGPQENVTAAIASQVTREYWNYPEDPNNRYLIDQTLTRGQMTLTEIDYIKRLMAEGVDRLINDVIDRGEQLITAAKNAEPEQIEDQIKQEAFVNYHDPRNGATALHYVAAQGARPALRALLKSRELDFLARDDRGRLASILAGTHGRDLAMERFLLTKAIRQARQRGIPLQQIYRRDAASRSARLPGP